MNNYSFIELFNFRRPSEKKPQIYVLLKTSFMKKFKIRISILLMDFIRNESI